MWFRVRYARYGRRWRGGGRVNVGSEELWKTTKHRKGYAALLRSLLAIGDRGAAFKWQFASRLVVSSSFACCGVAVAGRRKGISMESKTARRRLDGWTTARRHHGRHQLHGTTARLRHGMWHTTSYDYVATGRVSNIRRCHTLVLERQGPVVRIAGPTPSVGRRRG